MVRQRKFGFVLSPAEKEALECLARHERLSAAAVVRRLVWREAELLGLCNGGLHTQPTEQGQDQEARDGD